MTPHGLVRTALAALALAMTGGPARALPAEAIAMHGAPALAPGTPCLPYANPAAPKGGRLIQGVTGTFDSLNPFIIKGVAAVGVRELVYESLMKRSLDEPFTMYGLLADTIDVPDDRSRATFHLRPEARFSDGSPVTVDDVVFSLETLRAKGWPYHRLYYSKVAEVERPDPQTVTFLFAQTTPDRELPLILANMPILSKNDFTRRAFDATSLAAPVGSGPYRIAAVDPGRSITYQRNPDYWGRDLWINRGVANFDTLRYDYYRDDTTALAALLTGNSDLRIEKDAASWTTDYTGPAIANGSVVREEIAHHRASGMYGFVFNARRAPFDDLRVRRALARLFDFERVNRTLLHGVYVRTRSYFDGTPLAAKATPEDAASERDRRRLALVELKEAGWSIKGGVLTSDKTGHPFRFEIALTQADDERLALVYAASLRAIGITVDVRRVDAAQYQGRLRRFDFDMTPFRWDGTLSPGNEQAYRWGSAAAKAEGSYNIAGVNDPKVDAAIEALLAARTRDDLVVAAQTLDGLLMGGVYVLPLFHAQADWIAHSVRLAHADRIPLTGADLLTWWTAPRR